MKKKVISNIVMIVCAFVLLFAGFYLGTVYQEYIVAYKSSLEYCESQYNKQPTTNNLWEVVKQSYNANNMKYLAYVDIFLARDDCNACIQSIYPDNSVTDIRDTLLANKLLVCQNNDDIDSFLECLPSVYMQLEQPGQFRMIYSRIKDPKKHFVETYQNEIVEVLKEISKTEENLSAKADALETLYGYYEATNNTEMLLMYKSELEEMAKQSDTAFEWRTFAYAYTYIWQTLLPSNGQISVEQSFDFDLA